MCSLVWLVPFCQESSCYFYCIVFTASFPVRWYCQGIFPFCTVQSAIFPLMFTREDIPSRRQEWRRGMFEKKMFKRSHYYCLVMSLSSYCVCLCARLRPSSVLQQSGSSLFLRFFSGLLFRIQKQFDRKHRVRIDIYVKFQLFGLLRWKPDCRRI